MRTDAGDIDATIESQLERLRDLLFDERAAGVSIDLRSYTERVRNADPYRVGGRVAEVIGLVVEANGPEVEVGEVCAIGDVRRGEVVLAQVVGFRTGRTLLMPLVGHAGDPARAQRWSRRAAR